MLDKTRERWWDKPNYFFMREDGSKWKKITEDKWWSLYDSNKATVYPPLTIEDESIYSD